jgi:small nuclear ribonucleoprotein (snRNP)-like protein
MPKQELLPELKKYLSRKVNVKLNGNRVVTGRLTGFDYFMNLVLEEAVEDEKGEKRDLGVMVSHLPRTRSRALSSKRAGRFMY